MSFRLYVTTPEVVEDARLALKNDENTPGKCSPNFPKFMKCNIGKMDYNIIKAEQIKLKMRQNTDRPIVLVIVEFLFEEFKTYVSFDKSEYFETADVNKLGLESLEGDCFFLTGPNDKISGLLNKQITFAVRNYSRVKYIGLVEFTAAANPLTCRCDKANNEHFFCQNCDRYFCQDCWLKYHESEVFKEHKRVIEHFSACNQVYCELHYSKRNEFYCLACKSVYCVQCLTQVVHKEYSSHEVKFIDEAAKFLEQEKTLLDERVREFDSQVDYRLSELRKEAGRIKESMEKQEGKLREDKNKVMQKLGAEAKERMIYIGSLQAEIFRLAQDLEAKFNFLRFQFYNADVSTYIYFRNIFDEWVRNDMEPMLHYLESIDFSGITEPIRRVEI